MFSMAYEDRRVESKRSERIKVSSKRERRKD